jgi:hypothetical protein
LKTENNNQLEINAYICPKCRDSIFSRAQHDFRSCSCGEIFVDGGFSYTRVGYKDQPPEFVKLKLNITKKELYDDYNYRVDKYGLIKKLK